LRGVTLVVFVDRDLDNFSVLERDVAARSRKILKDEGILAEGPDGVNLSLQVNTFPAIGHLGPDTALIEVTVELIEQVRLVRDPSLNLPGGNGAVTWSRRCVSIVSRSDLDEVVAREIDLQVGSFAADVRAANK
jgi:hypothetical protein